MGSANHCERYDLDLKFPVTLKIIVEYITIGILDTGATNLFYATNTNKGRAVLSKPPLTLKTSLSML